jgi:carbon monoxide dehydrogenase subunit G
MPEESNTITIARPVTDVFAFLANAENDTQWRSGIIEMTRAGGEGVGTKYRQIVAGPGGRRIDADVEITEYVPDHRIAFLPRGSARLLHDVALARHVPGSATDLRGCGARGW